MALAATLKKLSSTSDLSPNFALCAKIIVVGLLLKGYLFALPEIFLPFVPVFDLFFAHGYKFEKLLQLGFAAACLMILFNWRAREGCLLLAGVIFVATLANRLYYSNNKMYVATIFLWIGLYGKSERPILLYWQLALVYFAASLNKLLEPDWQSGQYMHYWLGEIAGGPVYSFWYALLPSQGLAMFLSWSVILAEFSLAIMLFNHSWKRLAVWTGILLHSGALLLSGGEDFQIFTIAILASYLALFSWDQILKWRGSPWHFFILTALMCVPNKPFRVWLVMAALLLYSPLGEILTARKRTHGTA